MKSNRRKFIKNSLLSGIGISALNITNEAYAQIGYNYNSKYSQNNYFRSIRFKCEYQSDGLIKKAIDIFKRVFTERTGAEILDNSEEKLEITLEILPKSLPDQSFQIKFDQNNKIFISASDENGILYGIGKLLHTSRLNEKGFSPGKWEGISIPKKPFRAIYFATHFYNYYHVAPIDEVKRYVEELSLWGYNHLLMWFDMHHYSGIKDAKGQQMLDRLATIYKEAKYLGMKVFCGILANEGYNNSPVQLRAEKTGRSHYGVEICPSIKEGEKLILKQVREEFSEYKKRGVIFDGVSMAPYDQGGCGCDKCRPWGCNGFINISESITNDLRKYYPNLEVILLTWLFDYGKDQGEWKGLAERFEKHPPHWVDYLLADSHTTYPEYLLKNPVPGKLPLINFPEISMWGQWPWGGFGATPLPNRFQNLWDTVKNKVAGGFPYSEGIYADINQVLYSQFYWHENINSEDVIREYISYEFSEKYTNEIAEAIKILEKNHGLGTWNWFKDAEYGRVDVPDSDFGAEKAYYSLKEIDEKLPLNVRKRWRWRILIIRAMMDYEFRLSGGKINKAIEDGLQELYILYYTGKGDLGHDQIRVIPPINYGEIYRKKNAPKMKGTNQ